MEWGSDSDSIFQPASRRLCKSALRLDTNHESGSSDSSLRSKIAIRAYLAVGGA